MTDFADIIELFPFVLKFSICHTYLIIIKLCPVYINCTFYMTEMLMIVYPHPPPHYIRWMNLFVGKVQGKHKDSLIFFKKTFFFKSQILRIRHCLPILKCCLFFKVIILPSKYILV